VSELAAFVPACFALNMVLGPSNLLSVTYGARRGIGVALTAGSARLAVFAMMIAASAAGLGLLLSASGFAFGVVKILGAIYLVIIGIRLVLMPRPELGTTEAARADLTVARAARTEALVAAGNPKAILIFVAFFPQFVDQQRYALSYLVLAAIYLALEAVAIAVYATLGRVVRSFAGSRLHWLHRCSGVTMIVFGALLLLTPQPARTS
jgi:threonine/homoserine/homoserine lactone efflux protein